MPHPNRFPHHPGAMDRTRTTDKDLPLLRADVTGELIAIVTYRRFLGEAHLAATRHVFEHVINNEIGHVVELSRLIARLDPVQAQEFRFHELDWLLKENMPPPEAMAHISGTALRGRATDDTMPVLADGPTPAHLHDISAAADDLDRLNMAMEMELTPINQYEDQVAEAQHEETKDLIAGIMNNEKEHLAEFMHHAVALAHAHHP